MPLVTPNQNESRSAFISRCVSSDAVQNESSDNDQALAICISQWERSQEKKNMSINDQLLKAIRARQQKQTEFNYGILTADCYVKTFQEMIGSDNCYRFASKDMTSFADVLEKAARTLVYGNPDMVVQDKARNDYSRLSGKVELPKNTLMVFRHVLTTSRKDRDGDILRTEGLEVDPKMLLLWQHIHTMPIGKMLREEKHDTKQLILDSCIIDMNETCHDAAVMVDNDMGRFSHGFNASEFDRVKMEDGSEGGFDIRKGEILEESLVSVPANVDANTVEVLLSLIEGGKLTSPLMKEIGKGIREKRNVVVPVNIDLKVSVNGQELQNEDKSGSGETKGIETTTSTSEKANGDSQEQTEEKSTPSKEMIKMLGSYYLPGSWEYIEGELREKVNKLLISNDVSVGDSYYSYIIGTFADYVFIEHESYQTGNKQYFRTEWGMEDEEPVFTGEFKEVDIEMKVDIQEKLAQCLSTKDMITKAVTLYSAGRSKANKLVSAGKVKKPDSWSAPSASKQNSYIEANGIKEYSRWFLGIRSDTDTETKGAYAYPYTSDFKNVDRAGLVAIRQRSAQQGVTSIFEAAGKMLDKIDGEEGSSHESDHKEITVKEAMAFILAKANESERKQLGKLLGLLNESEKRSKRVKKYRAFKSSK